MNLGVVSRAFASMTCDQAAACMQRHGFVCTELCLAHSDADFWRYNGRRDLTDMTDARFRSIVHAFRSRDIEVVSLGVFTNLIEPDAVEREANLAYFEQMMRLAMANDIPYVSTECGFVPGRRGIDTETYARDFDQLCQSLLSLADAASRYNVTIAFEPSVIDLVPSAKRTSDLLDQLNSDRIRVLLDPANLIANSTEAEMFQHLAPKIAYLHGKDRKVNDTWGRALGDGDIDWPHFLSLYRRYADERPFILEYVAPENAATIRDRVLHADEVARSRA